MFALVIDDSRTMRRMIGNYLRELGFEVAEAGNGREALDLLPSLPKPDLMLVDWHMPEMDGYEFVRAVRRMPEFSSCDLMMVTTESEVTQMVRALDTGANEYLLKPFTKDALLDKIEILRKSR